MFDNFRDYMFYLLPAALKKKKQHNQFYLFCKVAGAVFDDIKTDLLQVRREASVKSCSDCMLEVAGQDRDMVRLKGETPEDYRRRLSMKAIIAEQAGTSAGLIAAVKSVGYACTIVPLYLTDGERWAEINLNFYTDSIDDINTIDFQAIKSEVLKTKKASTLPHYNFYYQAAVTTKETGTARTIHRYVSHFYDGILYLDGSKLLDGSAALGGEFYPITVWLLNRTAVWTQERVKGTLQVKKDLYYLDGSTLLDGSRTLAADEWEEKI